MELHTVDTRRVRFAAGSGSSPAPSAPIGLRARAWEAPSVGLSPVPVTPRYDGLVDCVQRIGWLPSCFIHAARFGGPPPLST